MDTKHTKNSGVTFFALAFIVALLFELYFILNDPTNYFMMLGVGIILIITGYLTFDSMERARISKNKAIAEQNDLMIKAEKAIYLATKRNSQEAQKQHAQNMKAIEYMVNKIVSNEKDMFNLLISKNEEIASKQIPTSANIDSPSTDMTALIDQLTATNAMLAKEIQSAITVNELVKANADLVKNVREVLDNSSGLSQETLAAYVENAVPEIKAKPSEESIISDSSLDNISSDIVTDNVTNTNTVINSTNDLNDLDDISTINSMDTIDNMDVMDNMDAMDNTSVIDNNSIMDNDNIPDSNDIMTNNDVVNNDDITDNDDIIDNDNTIDNDNITDNNDTMVNSDVDVANDLYDENIIDEFAFETFDIADSTSDTIFESSDIILTQDIVDDINISTLNDMVEEEGSVIAPAISETLDEEMSQGEAESVLSVLNGDTNRQLTEAEIAALFANI